MPGQGQGSITCQTLPHKSLTVLFLYHSYLGEQRILPVCIGSTRQSQTNHKPITESTSDMDTHEELHKWYKPWTMVTILHWRLGQLPCPWLITIGLSSQCYLWVIGDQTNPMPCAGCSQYRVSSGKISQWGSVSAICFIYLDILRPFQVLHKM